MDFVNLGESQSSCFHLFSSPVIENGLRVVYIYFVFSIFKKKQTVPLKWKLVPRHTKQDLHSDSQT